MIPKFFKKQERESLITSFRKRMASEREWKRHRFKFMTAIRDFHHSPEGRKFHRKLDRFNLTHTFRPKGGLIDRKKLGDN